MKRLCCLAFLFCLAAAPAAAGPDSWADLFAGPCARYDVPESLVLAIARQESQFYPWAVNIQGKSYYPASREEAVALLKAKARGKSFDVGLMQVNSWWLRKLGISPETALEPRNNILIGVWILAQEIGRHGLTWKAVASYHTPLSRNPERGRRYAASVVRHLKQLSQQENHHGNR